MVIVGHSIVRNGCTSIDDNETVTNFVCCIFFRCVQYIIMYIRLVLSLDWNSCHDLGYDFAGLGGFVETMCNHSL